MPETKPCTHCGADLKPDDRFCPLCGEGREEKTETGTRTPGEENRGRCPSCGRQNDIGATDCLSCGAGLGAEARRVDREPEARIPGRDVPYFQSWKFTLTAAVILGILVVAFLGGEKETGPGASAGNPHDAVMMERIQQLQEQIDRNPTDTTALLGYANVLFDVRFFQRAVEMYDRYLALNPANPDARVDMGTAYFELSLGDTELQEKYLQSAKSAFEQALTYRPGHQLAHFNLGIIDLQQGDMAGARRWFEKCIALDPESEAARRAAQLLSQHVQQNPT